MTYRLILACDMVKDCNEPVTHIGEKGYVYCSTHAPDAPDRQGWERTRKLKVSEIKQLLERKPLASFK